MSSSYPYATTHDVIRGMPSEGRSRASILQELEGFAKSEDQSWETGKVSGTMYCGDHEHYEFLGRAFELFAHVNALQRDICPSMTKFEGEIIAMTLDMLNAPEEAVGLVTSGGSGSILHAVLAYREWAAQERGIRMPNFVKPETAHPAFDKACHLLGIECRRAPVDPKTTLADLDAMASLIDENTIAMVGSACNYGYGTIDPIEQLGELALARGIGLHVDGCLGGFILPWGQELGYPNIPVFDFRIPGVTTISADTHKYGYGLKGTSVLSFRHKAMRNAQYFFMTDWTGGKYASPGIEGSRSGGMLAATWASMVSFGREGYKTYAKRIFDTAEAMKESVRSHPELYILGQPTFCFSFTSNEFDIYHVNDAMRQKGWRFNGQQYPNAIHMAVTRPQTQPGVTEAFATDLDDAVQYAHEHKDEKPMSAAIYGGVEGGMTDEADEFIRSVMEDMLDKHQGLPRG